MWNDRKIGRKYIYIRLSSLLTSLMLFISACNSVSNNLSPTQLPIDTIEGTLIIYTPTSSIVPPSSATTEVYLEQTPTSTISTPIPGPPPDLPLGTDAHGAQPEQSGTLINTTRSLSSLQTRVQEQIKWSVDCCAGGSGSGDYCPNHQRRDATTGALYRDAIRDWLVVGSPGQWLTRAWGYSLIDSSEDDFRVGKAAGIGRASALCINLLGELQIGTPIEIKVTKPNGEQEIISYSHSDKRTPTGINIDIERPDGTLEKISGVDRIRRPDLGLFLINTSDIGEITTYTLIYYHNIGATLGEYGIALKVNHQEVAKELLNVGVCECPTMQIFNRNSYDSENTFNIGEQLIMTYTGFRPNQTVNTKIYIANKDIIGKYDLSHELSIVTNERGEYGENLYIDEDIRTGSYIVYFDCGSTSDHSCANPAHFSINEKIANQAITPTPKLTTAPTQGMKVIAIEPNSVAERSGFKVGQILVQLAGRPINNVDDVREITAQNINNPIEAVVWFEGNEYTLIILLTEEKLGVDLCRIDQCSSPSQSQVPVTGMRIVAVDPNSPAAEAGLQVGWILVSLNDQSITDAKVARNIANQSVGSVEAVVWDGSTRRKVQIFPRKGLLGIDLCELSRCQ